MFSTLCSLVLLHLFCLCCPVLSQTFPASLPQCKAGDTECLRSVMTTIIHTHAAGNKELNLQSIDPLTVEKFSVVQNEQSPVNIRLHLRNITLTGLKDLVVTKVVGFGLDPKTSKFEVAGTTKRMSILGKYTLNGKVLILPITGNGLANLTFENVNIRVKVFPKVEEREGKEFVVIERVRARFTTTKFIPHFTNLFNDESLSKNMNLFLQQSSGEIFKEVKGAMEQSVSEVVKTVVSGPFGKFPYRDLFLP